MHCQDTKMSSRKAARQKAARSRHEVGGKAYPGSSRPACRNDKINATFVSLPLGPRRSLSPLDSRFRGNDKDRGRG